MRSRYEQIFFDKRARTMGSVLCFTRDRIACHNADLTGDILQVTRHRGQQNLPVRILQKYQQCKKEEIGVLHP